jgi:hypothetical protein
LHRIKKRKKKMGFGQNPSALAEAGKIGVEDIKR